jgi:hypothetical protein
MISPHSYAVLTSNSVTLQDNYPQGKTDSFIQLSLPSFPDDEGSVAIATSGNILIDHFSYSRQFHSELIKDDEGVSLERISFFHDSNDKENWGSATSVSGFATPGFLNSNFRSQNVLGEGNINIDPPVFAPNSGRADFSLINFKFDQVGFVASVKIYDQQGRAIKTIANNVTLGDEGFFRWDGDQDDGG